MSVAPYLAELDAALSGPRRPRRDLLQEARDHLADATDAYRRAGYGTAEAERQAVVDFGTVHEVAPGFRTTLAVASARRTSWMLLAVLACQPLLWDGPLSVSPGPDPHGGAHAVLDQGVEVIGAVMISLAALMVVASGIGNRWFHAGRGIARTASFVAIGSAVLMKITAISMTLLASGLGPAHYVMLVGCIVLPMSLTAISARRTLTIC